MVTDMLEPVTRHKHPLESQDALFIKAESGYEIFIYAGKGYPIIGPMRAQGGGTLC